MKLFGHVEGMGEEKQLKRVMRAQMQVKRPRGRPRTRWKDVIKRDLETSGLSLEESAAEAHELDGWRQKLCLPHATTMLRGVQPSKASQDENSKGSTVK